MTENTPARPELQASPLTHSDYDFHARPAASLRNLALVALLGGFIPDERLLYPSSDDDLSVVDIGAGPGFAANAFAFMYPGAHFNSVDHNPELAASAETLKSSLGNENVTVHHGSLDDFNRAQTGKQWDVALSLDTYGQMVSEDRPGVFDTFEQVKDGGLVLFTYNCSVFNTQFDPFREFLKLFIDTMGQEPIEQTKGAMHLMDELVGEQAGYFSQNLIADRFRRSAHAGARKVYQEFMNIEWEHYFAHEILPLFLRRGFKLCGDAAHVNNAKAQALPVSMVERLNRYPNRIISETLYDFSVNRSHRSDLYIKNAEKVSSSEIIDFWADARLVLRVKHEQLEMNRTFRLNEDLRLNPAKFGPVFSALASGPEKFGQLRRFFPDGPEGDAEMIDIIRIGHALGYLNLYYGEDVFEDHDQSVLDFDAGLTAWIRETKAPAYQLFLPYLGEFRPVPPGLYALAVSARAGGEDDLVNRGAEVLRDIMRVQAQAGVIGAENAIENAEEIIEGFVERFNRGLRPILDRGGYFRAW